MRSEDLCKKCWELYVRWKKKIFEYGGKIERPFFCNECERKHFEKAKEENK